jgi:hypothetical protein
VNGIAWFEFKASVFSQTIRVEWQEGSPIVIIAPEVAATMIRLDFAYQPDDALISEYNDAVEAYLAHQADEMSKAADEIAASQKAAAEASLADKEASDKEASDKAATEADATATADKIAADNKAAAEKAAADKAAADKVAADKAAASKGK